MKPDTLTPRVELATLRLSPAPHALRVLARVLTIGIVALALFAAFAPWQQTAFGEGRVIAYAPSERIQAIEAPIEGRVVRLWVREGSRVRRGDPIVDLSDNDPAIVDRLRREHAAVEARIMAAKERMAALDTRIEQLAGSKSSAVGSADQRASMARTRVDAAERAHEAALATARTADTNVARVRELTSAGLRSARDLELAELEQVRARTEVDRTASALESARAERLAVSSDRLKVETDATAAIEDARASRATAAAEEANANAELARIEVRLARQASQEVVAPRDGTILRVSHAVGGDMVKAGDVVATLVPDTDDRAVELWLDGNDVPLVSAGEHVRLQFEGWPAVQFAGWPSVAVGTFGGTVALVDAADDGQGRFRVVVTPDPGEAWPVGSYLRQGTRAHGWIMLGRVRVGYELWRRFNGFPPSLRGPSDSGSNPTEKKK